MADEGDTMISKRSLLTGLAAAVTLPGLARAAGFGEYVRIPVSVSPIGRVLVPVTINGQGPYNFIMDTGAYSSGILDGLAKTLDLPFVEGRTQVGIGGADFHTIYRAHKVVFGEKLAQTDVVFGGVAHLGSHEDGLLAAGFLTSMPSELDFGLSEIRIYVKGAPDLSGYVPIKSYISSESAISSPEIHVYAKIDGIPLRLLVDTGSPTSLLIVPSVVKAHGLWDRYGEGKPTKSTGITGASVDAREVMMPDFSLSDIAIPRLPVKLMDPRFDQEDLGADGLLGSQFLKLFSMAVTPAGMALRPNAQTVITPDTASASASSPGS